MSSISIPITKWQKGQSTNSTATAFSVNDTKPTTTEPTASATRTVISRKDSSFGSASTLYVCPYGGNDNNDLFNLKVFGWRRLFPMLQSAPTTEYISSHICTVQCTLSSALPGVVGMGVPATELFCDIITLTTGTAVITTGTADIDMAWFLCDIGGYEYVEIVGDLDTGGDTMNWLIGY